MSNVHTFHPHCKQCRLTPVYTTYKFYCAHRLRTTSISAARGFIAMTTCRRDAEQTTERSRLMRFTLNFNNVYLCYHGDSFEKEESGKGAKCSAKGRVLEEMCGWTVGIICGLRGFHRKSINTAWKMKWMQRTAIEQIKHRGKKFAFYRRSNSLATVLIVTSCLRQTT